MHLSIIFIFTLYSSLALSTPTPRLGLALDKRADLPTLTLPYGTWRASKYDSIADIYTFKNIRFATPPVGNLRWEKPAPPQAISGVQDGSIGNQCIQAVPLSFTLARNPVNGAGGALINTLLSGVEGAIGNKDCLFLDIQVPGKAVRDPSGTKLLIVSWFYGGAYNIIPTFFDAGVSLSVFRASLDISLNPAFSDLATGYQSYLTSYTIIGDLNTDRVIGVFTMPRTISWPKSDNSGELVKNVLDVGDPGFSLISDTQTPKTNCDFWLNMQAGYVNLGGYAPPGAVVASNLVSTPANVSVNY